MTAGEQSAGIPPAKSGDEAIVKTFRDSGVIERHAVLIWIEIGRGRPRSVPPWPAAGQAKMEKARADDLGTGLFDGTIERAGYCILNV
jgi:hypothetical protein